MQAPDAFETLADACIANYNRVLQHGLPKMQAASRILLYALAEEIRRWQNLNDFSKTNRS